MITRMDCCLEITEWTAVIYHLGDAWSCCSSSMTQGWCCTCIVNCQHVVDIVVVVLLNSRPVADAVATKHRAMGLVANFLL